MNENFLKLKTPREINQDIAKRIRNIRKKQKLTQVRLSEKSGVSLGSVKRFENTGEISLMSLTKIAFALGMENELDELFSKVTYQSIQEVIDAQRR